MEATLSPNELRLCLLPHCPLCSFTTDTKKQR